MICRTPGTATLRNRQGFTGTTFWAWSRELWPAISLRAGPGPRGRPPAPSPGPWPLQQADAAPPPPSPTRGTPQILVSRTNLEIA